MACGLTAVNVKDFARNKTARFEAQDRIDDLEDLSHTAKRVQDGKLCIRLDRVHRRLDDARCDLVHPDAACSRGHAIVSITVRFHQSRADALRRSSDNGNFLFDAPANSEAGGGLVQGTDGGCENSHEFAAPG